MVTNRKKKSAFRRVAEWLHLWLGLISGLIVFIVCFTGGLWVWRYEIGYFTEKYQRVEVRNRPYLPPSVLIARTRAYLGVKKDTGATLSNLINNGPGRSVMIGYTFGKKGIANIYVDPYDGHIILDKRKPSTFECFILFVRAGHRFLWLPQKIGSPIVGSACLVFLVIIITGLIWWYPRSWSQKNRDRSFKIKWNANWKRLNIDLHNVAGFYASIFILFLTVTGIYFTFDWFKHSMYRTLTWKTPVELKEDEPSSDTTFTSKPVVSVALDDIWRQMAKRHPDFGRIVLTAPHEAKEPYEAMVFFGDGTIIYNRATYFYDQSTLKPLHYIDEEDRPYGELSAGEKLYRMNFDIHTGQILGLPTKILAFFACMIGASLPVTGTLIWYNRKWGKKKKKAASPLV
ncbi:putative iron-regulated membrane protein [Mucilaginibacter sp. SG538B]|uniref:PepSY-associated TM helix domain-containing protein n=1 Tax=Mucilaginibacter sp. SG538B TaxID=2587021 RepID=UPI00159D6698|nr:PepSY-associated TM helix domain-containing protein [Mucilaginibacter sp. SG538B]NVM67297.1 putative iron-regulated membrane protein [Mucilaginibacter sp. SG538B]